MIEPRQVATASHPDHGDDLTVQVTFNGYDRMALYLVTSGDRALAIGSIAALATMGYTVHWNPAPPRRWGPLPE
jgi:hypothetical protein